MRLRNNPVRASSRVVTGTVIDSKIEISQAWITGSDLSAEKYRIEASATHQAPRVEASAGGCTRWKKSFMRNRPMAPHRASRLAATNSRATGISIQRDNGFIRSPRRAEG